MYIALFYEEPGAKQQTYINFLNTINKTFNKYLQKILELRLVRSMSFPRIQHACLAYSNNTVRLLFHTVTFHFCQKLPNKPQSINGSTSVIKKHLIHKIRSRSNQSLVHSQSSMGNWLSIIAIYQFTAAQFISIILLLCSLYQVRVTFVMLLMLILATSFDNSYSWEILLYRS